MPNSDYYLYYLSVAKQAVKVQFLHDSLGTQINYKLSLHEFRLQI